MSDDDQSIGMPKKRDARRARRRPSPALDVHMQQHVQLAPLARSLRTEPVALPDVVAPDLASLVVRVPRSEPITEAAILTRLHELCFSLSDRRERPVGEPVAMGDDVALDVLGYAAGKLIPFSARRLFTELAPMPMLPGLAEGIVGTLTGGGDVVAVTLPRHYPVASLAGKPARFVVDVGAASEVSLLSVQDPEMLRRLDRGRSLDEVMDAIAAELDAEAGEALLVSAAEACLEALAAATGADIPGHVVNEEIVRKWGQVEGQILAQKGFSDDELREALEGWQSDSATRAEAITRIRASLALKAIIERDGIEVGAEDARAFVRNAFEDGGLPASEVKGALQADKALAKAAIVTALHLKALEHALAMARIVLEDDKP